MNAWRRVARAAPLALAMATASAQTPVAPSALATRAQQVLQDAATRADFNGAVVLMRDGQVVFEGAAGLAQRKPDRPYTPDTPSDGGSLAKTLTAALLWELVAEGRLAWDDPVQKHLPEYPYARHTVRELVTHRVGLPGYEFFDPNFAPGQVRDTIDLLRLVAKRKFEPRMAPGVRVEYDNLGFDTAALVAERITGRRIALEWRQRYWEPLGMATTYARPGRFADWPGPRVVGYQRKGVQWVPNDAFDGEAFIGASNVHASARDWARWGDAFARERVMPAARLHAGLAQPMFDGGMDNVLNQLSWYCDKGQQRCHYSGAYNGFFSQVVWDRSRREVVAWVSNSSLSPGQGLALTRTLIDTLAERNTAPEPAPKFVPIAKKDLAAWAGLYNSASLGGLRFTVQDGRAFLRVGQGELASAFQVARDQFYVPTLDLSLYFSGSPQAAVLHIRSIFHTTDAKRASASVGKT
jgi:CubicO group peptidase (beta-lactamase class C family)